MPIFKKGAAFNGNKATGLADGTASTDAATKGQMDVNDRMFGHIVRAGGFFGDTGNATVSIGAANGYYRPVTIGKGGTSTSVKVNVTGAGAGGTLIYLALYAHDPSTGLPAGAPVGGGYGNVPGDSTGLKSITISQAFADNTTYWEYIGAVGGSPTLSSFQTAAQHPLLHAPASASGYIACMLDWNSGGLTGPPTTPDARPAAGTVGTFPNIIFGA